jgi:LacI family transcriptional regulator
VNIDEFAKIARVSKATVSMVFNEDKRISRATKERVLKIAKKYNYRPSTIAKSLRNKKTRTIGLMLPDIINPFFPGILKGVEEVAMNNDYAVIFCSFDEQKEKESVYSEMLKDRWVDGIIFSGVTGSKEEEKFIKGFTEKNVPIVFIDRGLEGHVSNIVQIDNYETGYKGTKFLIELGHRRIAFVNGPPDVYILKERCKGYLQALQDNTLDVDESLIVAGEISAKTAQLAIDKLLELKEPPTAIFVMSDLVAISIQTELQKRRFSVPEDISIMGFDDLPLASIVNPALTTVAQPFVEMGREAMKLLLALIEDKVSIERKILINTQIIVRESTKKIGP